MLEENLSVLDAMCLSNSILKFFIVVCIFSRPRPPFPGAQRYSLAAQYIALIGYSSPSVAII